MGTTADKLAKLNATKADLKAALAEKGQTVEDVFSTYPAAVRAISGPAPNGRAWTQSNITTGSFRSLCYGNGLWVAGSEGGGLYYSTDGKTWEQSDNTTSRVNSICYANGLLVAATRKGIVFSDNGKSWVKSGSFPDYDFSFLHNAGGVWVSFCSENHTANNEGGIYYSYDGKQWTRSTNETVFSLCYGNGLWVAGLRYDLAYSNDGIRWTKVGLQGENHFCLIYYANGLWTASDKWRGYYYSTDGKAWTKATFNERNQSLDGAICCAGGLWVASDTIYGIFHSQDGRTWTLSDPDWEAPDYGCLFYNNGVWIGGNELNGLISFDGKTWTGGSFANVPKMVCLRYADGMWVIGSADKGLYYSPA